MKSTAIQGAANLLAAAPRAQGSTQDKVQEVDFSAIISQANFQNQETLQSNNGKQAEKVSGAEKTSDKKDNSMEKELGRAEKSQETQKAEMRDSEAQKTEMQPKEETAASSEDRDVNGRKEDSDLQDIPEEVISKVSEFLKKIQEVFKEGFSMTDEELLSALEQLGFTMADFVNPETMNACIQALSGAQDSMTLLIDEQLYDTCNQVQKEVMALTEVLGEEVQLTTEEMELVLSKLEEMQNQPEAELAGNLPKEAGLETLTAEGRTEKMPMEERTVGIDGLTEKAAEPVKTEQEPLAALATSQKKTEPKLHEMSEEPEEVKVEIKPAVESIQKSQQESNMAQQNLLGNQSQPEMQQAEPVVQNVFDADVPFTAFTTYDGSYESIIRQVAEQVRIQVTADTSTMEMQLNPESLGKLSLSVELKQGMLTAKFIAENEQVKEAIESQAVMLREDLDKQGVKVEAIEVAVETHEFERNLEQGQQQSQAEEEARNAENERSRSRRNLNLDILEEEDELTEAEDLAAKIMKENGNTMDYFA